MDFQLLAGGLFEVILVEGEFRSDVGDVVANGSAGLPTQLLLLQPSFESGETPLERFVDRRGRGRQATLLLPSVAPRTADWRQAEYRLLTVYPTPIDGVTAAQAIVDGRGDR